MTYFVTGATGFIGKRLVKKLLARRGATVYFLVRKESLDKVPALLEYWEVSAERAVAVVGDLAKPLLGVSKSDQKKLTGNVKHFFHLAAVYDLKADAESQIVANIDGTKNAVALANAIKAGIFQHVSSIAAAGMYEGVFREDMFDEAENLDHPYFATKHDSEKIVRKESQDAVAGLPPGHGRRRQPDRRDGQDRRAILFLQVDPADARARCRPWMPTIGIEGGRINIVPVDFVVDAIDHIAHAKEGNKKAFHLVDPTPYRIGDVLNIFARAAHAPQFSLRVNAALVGFIPGSVRKGLLSLTPVRRIRNAIVKDLGLPDDMLSFVNYPTRFDAREADSRAQGHAASSVRVSRTTPIVCGTTGSATSIPICFIDRTLKGQVQGRVVVITGGSSGIGLAAAHKIAQAGATTVIIARDLEKLAAAKKEIEAGLGDNENGGKVVTHSADLASNEGVDKATAWIVETFGGADVLVNNAGRSIRRGIESSYDRYHDFERTMQVNYFGALRMTMGLLPHMTAKRRGQIINISSIGVLTNAPRFSAYVASKAALDAWTACASSEFADVGIKFTTINMPLVRTPMIAPTKLYQNVPTLSPEEAGDMIVRAIVDKPVRIATRLGNFGAALHALAPRVAQIMMNTTFRMFPDSDAAKGAKEGEKAKASADQIAFANLMRGIHF